MAPARREDCVSGQRRGPATPGEDSFPSPGQKSFNISPTLTTPSRNRNTVGSIPLRRVWKPQSLCPIADWLGLIMPPRGEGFPSDLGRGPVAPGQNYFPSPGKKFFHISTPPTTRSREEKYPGSILPRRVFKPQSHWPIADWLGIWSKRAARVAPWANAAVPPHPERIRSHPRVRNPSIYLLLQQPVAVKKNLPGRYRPAGCGNHSSTGRLMIGWGSTYRRAAVC